MALNKNCGGLLAACLLMAFGLAGCAGVPVTGSPNQPAIPGGGPYHRIIKGETLWSVARAFRVDLDDLVRVNHIQDVSRIEVGQLIIIPKTQVNDLSQYSPEDFIWPLKGRVITGFGQSHNNLLNKGLNIEASTDTDVVASRGGKVAFYHDNFMSYGKTLIIAHSGDFFTVYSAKSAEFMVKPGDTVERGSRIARLNPYSSKGENYLHFEIRKGHVSKNPNFYLP